MSAKKDKFANKDKSGTKASFEYGLHTICFIYFETDDFLLIRHENAVPLFKHHLKEAGVQGFFAYIKEREVFYKQLYEHDNRGLLFHSLVYACNSAVDISKSYSRPPSFILPCVNIEVYRRYSTTGIAAVVTYWIEQDMSIVFTNGTLLISAAANGLRFTDI